MERALHYGFSTIAQAIAAAIALMGDLALYRLQSLIVAMDVPSRFLVIDLHVDAHGAAQLQPLLSAKDYEAILEQFGGGL